ncbi:MAG: diguanylate cyclase [Gammaproteobacteria bacterium]|nr:diguanylate cyclase [Gammaproteobacteria bacterium]MBT4078406.1 diguanylate cyclase [Gammaproteobacteria bacterium]MBT4861503.1 diguanylate cyclase [Gammaproteobacteria bacterium]MBT7208710.1 diguanylate cyclase [Gammaproteobacteria bacterium]
MESDLIRNLLSSDYSALYSSLDSQLITNANTWKHFSLHDDNGNQIYPLFAHKEFTGPHEFHIPYKYEIKLEGELLGYIEVHLDWHEQFSKTQQHILELELFLVIIGILLVVFILVWNNKVIIKPIINLQQAAEKVAGGDFNSPLQKVVSGEIGKLISAFDFMRTKVVAYQQHLLQSEAKLIDYSNALVTFNTMLSVDGIVELVNDSAVSSTGLSSDKIIGKALWETYWYNDDELLQQQVKADVITCASGQATVRELKIKVTGDQFLTIRLNLTPIKDNQGQVTYLVGEGLDITNSKAAEEALKEKTVELEFARLKYKQLSETDPLTKISNRRVYEERLTQEIASAKRSNKSLSLLMIDIDHFKQYNDQYGHDAGDVTLRRVAEVISEGLPRSTDLAVRFGGEEFVVLMPSTDIDGALIVAERIRSHIKVLSITHDFSAHLGMLTVSIGIASLAGDKLNEVDLLHHADAALYAAKDAGRNRSEIYTP